MSGNSSQIRLVALDCEAAFQSESSQPEGWLAGPKPCPTSDGDTLGVNNFSWLDAAVPSA